MAAKHGARYPWEIWFTKDNFTLKKGIHYDCRSDTMAQQVRTAGRRAKYGIKVSVSISEDGQRVNVKVIQRHRSIELV